MEHIHTSSFVVMSEAIYLRQIYYVICASKRKNQALLTTRADECLVVFHARFRRLEEIPSDTTTRFQYQDYVAINRYIESGRQG